MDDDKALSYLNTEGCTFSDQKQLTVKLKFHFQSGDPHSLDNLNSQCATNLQNDSVSLLSCILNMKDTSPKHNPPFNHSLPRPNSYQNSRGRKSHETNGANTRSRLIA
eukprot:scaffold8061_cov61-Attheya_sp.AAC.3